MAKVCVRCKRYRELVKEHSNIHIVRKGKIEYSRTRFVCEACAAHGGKWSAK